MGQNSYERRVYKSVDDRAPSYRLYLNNRRITELMYAVKG